MLTVLQLVDCPWVELNLAKDRVLAFFWLKKYIHMKIERALALTNLIRHANDLKMDQRSDTFTYGHSSIFPKASSK